MPFSPTATEKTALAVCDCPHARHEHGTRGMYGYHRCRCSPCEEANRNYRRQTAHLTRRREWADGNLARKRIALLREAGLTIAAIADLCGMNPKVIDYAIHGRNGQPPVRVLASTLNALNAIRARDLATVEVTDDARIDGEQSRLQIQALHAIGWSVEELAARGPVKTSVFYSLLRGSNTTEDMRRGIEDLYLRLRHLTPPEDNDLERQRAKRARRRAELNGWTPGMAEGEPALAA